jgi:beta-N-acetylhexosaminidase
VAPPLVGIEQAAGTIDRLKPIFGTLPGLRELAWLGVAQARTMARIIAAELEATGFNLNFAPVVDLDVPGSVSRRETLSWSPERVAELAEIFVQELSRKGVLSCARHFPGQGAASRDPHFALPVIERPKKFLIEHDVAPFIHLRDKVGMIMVGHARYPAFGGDRPASLAPQIMSMLLRKKLKFGGVIVTSDLTMGAITGLGLTPETFLEAFDAGADMLLFSQTTPLAVEAFRGMVKALRRSAAMRARLDHSLERILALKSRIGPPGRYRPHMKARIARQIAKIHKGVEVSMQVEKSVLHP